MNLGTVPPTSQRSAEPTSEMTLTPPPALHRAPYSKTTATLYYFGGRGLADQVRWMLAYSDVSYTQRVVGTRQRFLDLRSSGQLPFGQLPLLQIDGVEIVQSQAIVRYLARRANLTGKDAREEIGACACGSSTVRVVRRPCVRTACVFRVCTVCTHTNPLLYSM